jgi:rhamnose utilization protein RhaD (predicted bifunctional aldolase and dehydrogenase)/NAD(P)-dependent dehydrogenase (short-subunit alcohol dehydrogenase family)
MIENRYSKTEAEKWRASAGDNVADQELAERVYTSRLIGSDRDLLMHGGGNTSVKLQRHNLFGEKQDVLHVKGSGWDLDTIQAAGLPGVWLDSLLKLRGLDALSDENMVNYQRANLLDCASPNPSVETLLHAFLPHRYVDHTHATPFLILANLPNAEAICYEIFGDRLGIVPYIMPGFSLAKKAAEVYENNPKVEGLLLLNHGHFAFDDTAEASYNLIVSHTNEVADFLKMTKATSIGTRQTIKKRDVLPVLRGAIADVHKEIGTQMPVLDVRNCADVMSFFDRHDVEALAKRGMASPDHVLRTKGQPLILTKQDLDGGKENIIGKIKKFAVDYRNYFDRQAPNASEAKKLLSPDPKHAWVEGVGIIGFGTSCAAASAAADLAEQNMRVRSVGEDAGGFYPLGEKDMFDCEYWSLEQAKLGKGAALPLQGKIALVTGGAGTIGLATAQALAAKGASVMLVDQSHDQLEKAAETLGHWHGFYETNVTTEGAAKGAMNACIEKFGGIDILISNAGTARGGELLDLPDDQLRAAFELNFFAHHKFSTEAARIMKTQGHGGQILFNISKQAVNPGKNMGAYGMPKATTMFLMRQLALELGSDGITVNGINADRIRSGLLTDGFIKDRSTARGVSESDYMSGNLLQKEVEAKHVADAFLALALMPRTTGHVLTVDGGNTAAELR